MGLAPVFWVMMLVTIFVKFVTVLLGSTVAAWAVWWGVRACCGRSSPRGVTEVVVLLGAVALVTAVSPLLFGGLVAFWGGP